MQSPISKVMFANTLLYRRDQLDHFEDEAEHDVLHETLASKSTSKKPSTGFTTMISAVSRFSEAEIGQPF